MGRRPIPKRRMQSILRTLSIGAYGPYADIGNYVPVWAAGPYLKGKGKALSVTK